jgi:hypothetical protein
VSVAAAVAERLNPRHRADALLNPSVDLFHQVVPIPTSPQRELLRKTALCLQVGDGPMRRRVPVERDLLRHAMVAHCFRQEPLGGSHVSMFAQEKFDYAPLFVDGTIAVRSTVV